MGERRRGEMRREVNGDEEGEEWREKEWSVRGGVEGSGRSRGKVEEQRVRGEARERKRRTRG